MDVRQCLVCGQPFTPITGNGKYCSAICAEMGGRKRRQEWEARTGYLAKKRVYAQERRNAKKVEKAAAKAEATQRRAEERERLRLQREALSLSGAAEGRPADGAGGNTSVDYWESFKKCDLLFAEQSGKTSRTEVNGIPVQAADFGQLVHDTIVQGHPIIVRVCHD